MGDHEINAPDAEQYDHEIIKEAEVRAEFGDLTESKVLDDPKEGANRYQRIENPGFLL